MRDREAFRSWDVRKDEIRYQYEILEGIHIDLKKFNEIHFNPSLWRKLVQISPDIVIIGGYNSISSWIALLYSKLYKKKVIMWSGSIMTSSKFNQALIKTLRKIFIRSCDAFITYGTKARDFLEYYGAITTRIFTGCNVGDIDYYRTHVKQNPCSDVEPTARLIFVGRLEKNKGIFNLIEALGMVRAGSWHLSIFGDGPERDNLQRLCSKCGVTDRVTFAGFKQKEELAKNYGMSDIFVLPTFADKFSIVMSEALASGLFVIASIYDGASYDIVKEGINGYITDPHDIAALASCIDRAIHGLRQLPSKQVISDSISGGMDLYSQQFVDASQYVMGRRT